jgi:hypothetical protein
MVYVSLLVEEIVLKCSTSKLGERMSMDEKEGRIFLSEVWRAGAPQPGSSRLRYAPSLQVLKGAVPG